MLACTKNNLEIIKCLIENKAILNQCNKDGWNAFQIATREGHQKIVEYLLNQDETMAFSIKTKNGRTPCHTAALHGHLNIIKLILDKNQDKSDLILKAKDSCGNTPFMEAIIADHVEIVKFLVENYKCVSLNDKDYLGNSIIHLMAQSGSSKMFDFVFDIYYKNESKESDTKNDLIKRFSNTLNNFSMNPLHSACKNNKPKMVELILNKLSKTPDTKFTGLKQIFLELLNRKDSHGRTCIEICNAGKLCQIQDLFKRFLN